MNSKFKKAKLGVFSLLILLVAYYLFTSSPNLNPLYAEGAFFWCVLVTVIVMINAFFQWSGSLSDVFVQQEGGVQVNMPEFTQFKNLGKISKYVLVVVWGAFFALTIYSTVFFHWQSYRDQLGEPEVKTFSSDVQPIDLAQIPIVDERLAINLADKKLGERPSLGSQVMLGNPTIQMVNDKLVWVVPLEHSGLFQWINNLEGTPGYIIVSATNVNDVEYVDSHLLKYQPNAYLLDNLTRYVRFNSALFNGITDFSFELDEEGVPYWVITTYENLKGFALPEATGVLTVNASTGDIAEYGIDNIPDWVDRVQPVSFIVNQIYNKGEYVHGFLNFSDRDKYMPSEGSAIIYNNGNCYLFTGLTSVGNDESAIGFMMVDMVNKDTILYQMNGATERAAESSAEGKVQHLGYNASFPIILNVSNRPSYFMTLKDQEGLIKQYAFVSVESYSTVGVGETIQDALRDYNNALMQEGIGGDLSVEGAEEKSITGTVLRIESQFDGTQTVYHLLVDSDDSVVFTATTSVSAELSITQPGDTVSISYLEPVIESPIINVTAFDNNSLRIG